MSQAYTLSPTILAKVVWQDPLTARTHEFLLVEGATATIGRLEANDIPIKQNHVSRHHAVISYRDGVFTISDLESANGVFINGQKISEPYPLIAGDEIKLFEPTLYFHAVYGDSEEIHTTQGVSLPATTRTGKGKLMITNGPQEGTSIPLLLSLLTVGRATNKATWEIGLQDQSVSRPHAKLELLDTVWVVYDLNSANGTLVNGTPVTEKGRALHDGDVVTFGQTLTLFRTN